MSAVSEVRLREALTSLIGREIVGFGRVIVTLDDGPMEMGDSLILYLGEEEAVQISADGYTQWLRFMRTRSEYRIYGEFSDRTGDQLVDVSVPCGGFEVSGVHVADESGESFSEALVGFWLLSDDGPQVSVWCEADDVEIGGPSMLWSRLQTLFWYRKCLTVRRL